MIDLTFYQEESLRIIALHPQSNPITGVEIAKRIHLKDRDLGKEGADLRAVVNALRCKGFPICANSAGYYYARSKEQLDAFTKSFKGRIDKQTQAYNGMMSGYEKLDTEFELPEDMIVVNERSSNPEQVGAIMKKQQVWIFESRTKVGVKYTVSDFTSYLFCDCPAYNYKKRCRHTDQVKVMIAELKDNPPPVQNAQQLF